MEECELSVILTNSAPKHRNAAPKRSERIRNLLFCMPKLAYLARSLAGATIHFRGLFLVSSCGERLGVTREGATRTASSSIVVHVAVGLH